MSDKKKSKTEAKTDLAYHEQNGSVNFWSNKSKIREFFKDHYNLTEQHFQIFCAFGYSLNANPYAGEIIPIVFGKGKPNEKLSFILTRDFRGRIAQEQPDYVRHFVADVCENDTFSMVATKGYPDHEFDETIDRGALKGAYCVVWKSDKIGVSFPAAYVYAKYSQYKKTGPGAEVWDRIPNDQIKKVAEAHALRMAYYNKFGNTYDSAEIIHNKGVVIDAEITPSKSKFPEGPPPELEAKSEPQPKEKKKNETRTKDTSPDINRTPYPSDEEKGKLMDTIVNKMEQSTDMFLSKYKVKVAEDITDWDTYDKMALALFKG